MPNTLSASNSTVTFGFEDDLSTLPLKGTSHIMFLHGISPIFSNYFLIKFYTIHF